MTADRALPWYYATTLLFLLLDFGLGVNVRVAFLDAFPVARVGYYGICLACFVLMMWRPALNTLIGTIESLVTLTALIVGMAIRVLIPIDAIFEENAAIVTIQESINFAISGGIAYFAWISGLERLRTR